MRKYRLSIIILIHTHYTQCSPFVSGLLVECFLSDRRSSGDWWTSWWYLFLRFDFLREQAKWEQKIYCEKLSLSTEIVHIFLHNNVNKWTSRKTRDGLEKWNEKRSTPFHHRAPTEQKNNKTKQHKRRRKWEKNRNSVITTNRGLSNSHL